MKTKKSASLREMLRKGKGYRCESYSGSGVRRADKVVHFETFDLGNTHVIEDVCKTIHKKNCDWDERELFNKLEAKLSEYDALWLTTRAGVERYCKYEQPEEHPITKNMIPVCDLHSDGTLFLTKRARREARQGRTGTKT